MGTMKMKIDWPVVALIAVVGVIAIAALRVLGIEKADLAAMSAEQWTVMAGIVGGALGTCVVAFRGKVAERVPAPGGATKPPPTPPSSGVGPAAALLLAVAIPNVVGCGASALRVHATIADAVGRTVDPACDELGAARGRALDECAAEPSADADAACVARAREEYAPAVTTCAAAADIHDAWCDEIVRAEARGGEWSWAEGLPFAIRMLELAARLAADLHVDLPPELAQLAARGAQ